MNRPTLIDLWPDQHVAKLPEHLSFLITKLGDVYRAQCLELRIGVVSNNYHDAVNQLRHDVRESIQFWNSDPESEFTPYRNEAAAPLKVSDTQYVPVREIKAF